MPLSKAKKAEVADRRAKLVRLRLAGVKFDDERILALGYTSRQAASKDMIRALEEHRDEEAAAVSAYRQQENERLDALLEAVWPCATQPKAIRNKDGDVVGEEIDMRAVDTILRLMDRRAKLNGLDMPAKTELSGPDGGAVPFSAGDLPELETLMFMGGKPAGGNLPDGTGEDTDDDSGS